MISSKMLRNAAVVLGAVAVPVVIGVIGAAPSSADDGGLCVSGPFGNAQACVNLPGLYVPGWYYGPYWGGDGGHYGDGGDGGHHGYGGDD